MKIRVLIAILFIAGYSFGQKQEAEKAIQTGNEYYKQQQFEQAMVAYNKAVAADPSNNIAKFNLANTQYKQDKKEEAAKIFTDVANNSDKADLKEKAWYNKGVVLSRQKKLEESIEAYKNALRKAPEDKDARENLQKALLELKKKNPPEKKKEQDKKKQQDQQKKQQQQPKMSPKEAEQRLKLLEQKEKEVLQRLQKAKAKTGGGQGKDW